MPDVKELKEEDLKQVSGGGPVYSQNECRQNGFKFYDMSPTNNQHCEITGVKEFVDANYGWSYSVDYFINGVRKGTCGGRYTDYDIDFYISWWGQPQ